MIDYIKVKDFWSTNHLLSYRPLKSCLILWIFCLLSHLTLYESLWIVMLRYLLLFLAWTQDGLWIQDFASKIVTQRKVCLYRSDYFQLAVFDCIICYFQFSGMPVMFPLYTRRRPASNHSLDQLVTVTQERTMQKQEWLVLYSCHFVLIFG